MTGPDPIDDAIHAVVRAVDRIEVVTRSEAAAEADSAPVEHGKKPKKSKKARAAEAEAEQAAAITAALQQALAQRGALTNRGATVTSAAPAELHALVGRLVARTRQLDEHLAAAQGLREEITDLVAHIAALSADD